VMLAHTISFVLSESAGYSHVALATASAPPPPPHSFVRYALYAIGYMRLVAVAYPAAPWLWKY
jgi:hypothetical protein